MTEYVKFIPGPGWPGNTMGSKVVMPDGTKIPHVRNVTIKAVAGEAPEIIVETGMEIDELDFLPERVLVVAGPDFVRKVRALAEEFMMWNEHERSDGLIVHVDAVGDFMEWLEGKMGAGPEGEGHEQALPREKGT